MPIYSYQCLKCGSIDDVLQSLTAPAPNICPNCGHDSLVRVPAIGTVSFDFKGKGFYETDYKNK